MTDWRGNGKSVWATLGASNHTDKEREVDDFYATDSIAVDKLLSVETLNRNIWECAAGAGHLSKRLKEHEYQVYSTDIKDRGYPLDGQLDFLTATQADVPFQGACDILTNPPYKYAKEFVLKALELLSEGRKCYMFLKLTFLEGKQRYIELFKESPPRSIYVCSERVLCAKNGDFKTMKRGGGGAIAYAWYVWEKGGRGRPTIDWI